MVQLIMPKMGESVAEATILKWLKKEGDPIEADEPILEIATDKVDSEVPSPCAGIMSKRLFEEGQVVKVGEIIAEIAESGEKVSAAPVAAPVAAPAPAPVAAPVAAPVVAVAAAAPVVDAPIAPAAMSDSPLIDVDANVQSVDDAAAAASATMLQSRSDLDLLS